MAENISNDISYNVCQNRHGAFAASYSNLRATNDIITMAIRLNLCRAINTKHTDRQEMLQSTTHQSSQNRHMAANWPQIFRGASSSRSIGWLRKISRDFKHRPRISFSASCTFLPGREPRTTNSHRQHISLTSRKHSNTRDELEQKPTSMLCVYLYQRHQENFWTTNYIS